MLCPSRLSPTGQADHGYHCRLPDLETTAQLAVELTSHDETLPEASHGDTSGGVRGRRASRGISSSLLQPRHAHKPAELRGCLPYATNSPSTVGSWPRA